MPRNSRLFSVLCQELLASVSLHADEPSKTELIPQRNCLPLGGGNLQFDRACECVDQMMEGINTS